MRTAVGYSPAELHRRNPLDWAGVLQNQIVETSIRLLKSGQFRRADLCTSLSEWLDHSTDLQQKLPALQAYDRSQMKAALQGSPLCRTRHSVLDRVQDRLTSAAHARADSQPSDTLSTAALEAIDAVVESTQEASNPADLASRLGPILDGAPELGVDSIAVQGAVAIAQSSYEEWYDGSTLAAMSEPMEQEMDLCLQGE